MASLLVSPSSTDLKSLPRYLCLTFTTDLHVTSCYLVMTCTVKPHVTYTRPDLHSTPQCDVNLR